MEINEICRQSIGHYEALFKLCFPHSELSREYLEWLYFSNPLGDVVGLDAMDGNLLAAHYACIPTRIDGKVGLLALNTATHPSYRSRGIYKKIAMQTFENWSSDFNFVVGVANKLAANACVRHLGFSEIGRLNLRFGDLMRPTFGARSWSQAELDWRINSPRQQLRKKLVGDGLVEVSIRPKNFPFKIKSIVSVQDTGLPEKELSKLRQTGFTVDWIRDKKPQIQLPENLKPSPLVMIYQTLSGEDTEVNSWSFPDFDAF